MNKKGVGYAQVFSTAAVITYYLSIMGLTVRYFLDSFRVPLPWSKCKPEWGIACRAPRHHVDNVSTPLAPFNFVTGNRSSAELYYMYVRFFPHF